MGSLGARPGPGSHEATSSRMRSNLSRPTEETVGRSSSSSDVDPPDPSTPSTPPTATTPASPSRRPGQLDAVAVAEGLTLEGRVHAHVLDGPLVQRRPLQPAAHRSPTLEHGQAGPDGHLPDAGGSHDRDRGVVSLAWLGRLVAAHEGDDVGLFLAAPPPAALPPRPRRPAPRPRARGSRGTGPPGTSAPRTRRRRGARRRPSPRLRAPIRRAPPRLPASAKRVVGDSMNTTCPEVTPMSCCQVARSSSTA